MKPTTELCSCVSPLGPFHFRGRAALSIIRKQSGIRSRVHCVRCPAFSTLSNYTLDISCHGFFSLFLFFYFSLCLRCCILSLLCFLSRILGNERNRTVSWKRSGNGGPIGHAIEQAVADRLPALHHQFGIAILVHFRGGLLRARRNGRYARRARRPSPPAIRYS